MNRPGISHIGHVDDDGETIFVHGWGLTDRMRRCDCHRDGPTGELRIAPSNTGALGLVSYRACDCCTAWTVDELTNVVRDLAQVTGLAVA